MSTLSNIVHRLGHSSEADVHWLHMLVGDWQLIADLAFADIVLWMPTFDERGYVAVAHARPSSAATLFYRDFVGQPIRASWREQVHAAFETRQIVDSHATNWYTDSPTRVSAIPVMRRLHSNATTLAPVPVAIITKHSNLGDARTPGRQELTFNDCAKDLLAMVASGDFPDLGAPTGPRRGAPRASDGLIRLGSDGVVTFVSPNALSAFNRMGYDGELEGRSLAEVVTGLIGDAHEVDESLPLVVTGRAPWRTDIEVHAVTLSMRTIPVRSRGVRSGAIVLCRDVTELRHQEQSLITKDATIREIHHRVKNNLQTVAALLRIQARRSKSAEAKDALSNAERRVAAIAVVHDTLSEGLSQSVDFDEVLDRTLVLTTEVASGSSAPVRAERVGSFGELPSGYATPLALALTELVTNAIEHGLDGRENGVVQIVAERSPRALTVRVIDNGRGITEGTIGSGLGTQIIRTLIQGELSGTIDWASTEQGTVVTIDVPLVYLARAD